MAEVLEQNQTVEKSEVVEAEAQVGKEEAVETATTETDAGLLEGGKSDGLSIEDIMSEGEVEPSDIQDDDPHGVKKRIGKVTNRAKQAESRVQELERENEQLKTVQHAPTERPLVPVREDYETAEDYRADYAKYEDNTIAFNNSQNAVNDQNRKVEQQRQIDGSRFQEQAVRLRAKFPDFDALVTTDNPDGSNPFGGVADLVLSAENNAGLAYFLRKNPAELESLNTMGRNKALLKIGELSGRFNKGQKKTTKAPKTLNTIKEGSDTPVVNIYDIKDNSEFLKARNKEIRQGRNRGG